MLLKCLEYGCGDKKTFLLCQRIFSPCYWGWKGWGWLPILEWFDWGLYLEVPQGFWFLEGLARIHQAEAANRIIGPMIILYSIILILVEMGELRHWRKRRKPSTYLTALKNSWFCVSTQIFSYQPRFCGTCEISMTRLRTHGLQILEPKTKSQHFSNFVSETWIEDQKWRNLSLNIL